MNTQASPGQSGRVINDGGRNSLQNAQLTLLSSPRAQQPVSPGLRAEGQRDVLSQLQAARKGSSGRTFRNLTCPHPPQHPFSAQTKGWFLGRFGRLPVWLRASGGARADVTTQDAAGPPGSDAHLRFVSSRGPSSVSLRPEIRSNVCIVMRHSMRVWIIPNYLESTTSDLANPRSIRRSLAPKPCCW